MTDRYFYARLDEHRFRPGPLTGGAWRDDEMHMGPVSALLTHVLEQHAEAHGQGLQLGRTTFEVLGVLWADDLEVTVEVVRPGRTIELVEAVLVVRGRPAARARAWLMSRQDTSAVAGGAPEAMPAPASWPAWDGGALWKGDYIRSLELHRDPDSVPGRARAWLRTDVVLLVDEPVGDLAQWVALVDTANGVGTRRSPAEWMFPNLDLTLHLWRRPSGPWAGLDVSVVFGADGVGVTSTVLHDESGAVGRAEQVLTLRPMP